MEKSEPEIPNRGKTTNYSCDIRDFTTTPLPIPKIFLVVYLLNLRSECLVSYDPHFPGNDGTNEYEYEPLDELIATPPFTRCACYYRYTYGCLARWHCHGIPRYLHVLRVENKAPLQPQLDPCVIPPAPVAAPGWPPRRPHQMLLVRKPDPGSLSNLAAQMLR